MKALIATLLLMGFVQVAGAQEMKSASLYAEKIYCEACAATAATAKRGFPSSLRKVEP